jgi:hypothetical protein
MQGNATGRVRVLSDSVGGLAVEIRAAVNQIKSLQAHVTLQGGSLEIYRAVTALEGLVKELATSNQNLARMTQAVRGPLMSLIAGQAEAELERLKGKVEELREALRALIRAVKG